MKIRILPNKSQELMLFKSAGVARFIYNWALNRWGEIYDSTGEKPNYMDIKKEFNNSIKKLDEYKWLYETSSQTQAQVFSDLNIAFNNFFKRNASYPKFKTKKKSKKSFYVRYDTLKFDYNYVNVEKIGKLRYSTNYNIPIVSYKNPRCSFDGKYWYISFSYDENQINEETKFIIHNEKEVKKCNLELNNDLVIGIDLGIKYLAVVNILDSPIININKTNKVKYLEKKLRRLQRNVSRKYEMNKKEGIFIKTNNIIRLEKQIKLIYRKLSNIRNNHINQSTSKIIKLGPNKIVMEDLNISGMMKNKYLSKSIQDQCLYEFIRQIRYKSELNGIEFVKADRFYPSSKKCSCCGNIKTNLRLKDRVYSCDKCGLKIDRDRNSSINLANYKSA